MMMMMMMLITHHAQYKEIFGQRGKLKCKMIPFIWRIM